MEVSVFGSRLDLGWGVRRKLLWRMTDSWVPGTWVGGVQGRRAALAAARGPLGGRGACGPAGLALVPRRVAGYCQAPERFGLALHFSPEGHQRLRRQEV